MGHLLVLCPVLSFCFIVSKRSAPLVIGLTAVINPQLASAHSPLLMKPSPVRPPTFNCPS